MSSFLTDLEIANQANKKHINHIAKQIDVPEEALIVYGNDKAKINYDFLDKCKNKKDGKLILVKQFRYPFQKFSCNPFLSSLPKPGPEKGQGWKGCRQGRSPVRST